MVTLLNIGHYRDPKKRKDVSSIRIWETAPDDFICTIRNK